MKSRIITYLVTLLLLASCDNHKSAPVNPPESDPAAQAIESARSIMSDPSNWKSNTKSLTDLATTAQDLGISDTTQFKDFDTAAQDLIVFGTKWITHVNEGSMNRLRDELAHITKKTDSSVDVQAEAARNPMAGAQINQNDRENVDAAAIQTEAEKVVFTSIEGLRAAQADEFGKIYSRAQTSFRSLRLLLQTKIKQSHPSK